MATVTYNPDLPIDVELAFDSPQAVSYSLFHKAPGADFSLFARGTDEEGVQVSAHQHRLSGVSTGTVIKYRLIFGGNPASPIKAEVLFKQNGVALADARFPEGGACDQDGVAVRSKEVTFNA